MNLESTMRHLAYLSLVSAIGCQDQSRGMSEIYPIGFSSNEELAMTDPDANGMTGADLLAAAEQQLASFDVHWDVARRIAPATDRLTVTFASDDAVASLARTISWHTNESSEPYLLVTVPVTVTNTAGTLTASADLFLHSPDLATHGVYAHGIGLLSRDDLTGDYYSALMEDAPPGRIQPAMLRFETSPSLLYADSGVSGYQGPPLQQLVQLAKITPQHDRWYVEEPSDIPYPCATHVPCVQPVDLP